jgi:hypothetical protein
MATSPNYNWPEPDNTDLVKNGALAIRTAVNAIDTSLGELLGGTTGQVLSKTSNTNMDFTWVTTDDANAIQNAIVDAKGDLIAATANDTPARLAVGTNYGFLQADSTAATGLLWNNAGWTSFTPTATSSGGTITSYTSAGYYTRIGKLCVYRFKIEISNNGTGNGYLAVSAPFTASTVDYSMGSGREDAVLGYQLQIAAYPNSADLRVYKYDNTYPGVSGCRLLGTISYEVV